MTVQMEQNLHAYIDGELGPDEAAAFEARLDGNAAMQRDFEAIARQSALIREASIQLDTAPRDLRTAALERQLASALSARQERARRVLSLPQWPMQFAAACALVAAGWWAHDQIAPPSVGLPDYVEDAVGAHTLFANATDYAVEFSGAALPGAIAWLSTQSASAYPEPDLSALGGRLVGARVLASGVEPLVQYVYEASDGTRLSVIVKKHAANDPLQGAEFVSYPGSEVGYWRNADFDYAVVTASSGIQPTAIAAVLTN